MKKPILYVFSISHYCEKARWALDYLGVEYQQKALAPGLHLQTTKKLGLSKSSVPILAIADKVIQGSADIINWAEQTASASQAERSLPSNDSEIQSIEKRLDDVLGVHVRRQFYSEAILHYPHTVKPIFNEGLSMLDKLKFSLIWSKVTKTMVTRMDLGPQQRLESKAIVDTELDWLNSLLADGREYLAGDSFSRADLTAASLLAPLVVPPEHPLKAPIILPPLLQQDVQQWEQGKILNWVRKMYAEHR